YTGDQQNPDRQNNPVEQSPFDTAVHTITDALNGVNSVVGNTEQSVGIFANGAGNSIGGFANDIGNSIDGFSNDFGNSIGGLFNGLGSS
ncbi:hypothetical protein ABTK24_19445, partial [Acinetobacter baumannii]